MLHENVVEGCVGESYGALVAMWQAERARDPAVSSAMRRIARDEARHAALSWALLRWGAARLTAPSRRKLDARMKDALTTLRVQADREVDDSVVLEAGYPPPAVARELVARFERWVVAATARSYGPAARAARAEATSADAASDR
jgi:hypothetical protein